MPQMDQETFVEYIFWIFLILLHQYTSFFINSAFMKFICRQFLVNRLYSELRILKEHKSEIRIAFEKFNHKKFY